MGEKKRRKSGWIKSAGVLMAAALVTSSLSPVTALAAGMERVSVTDNRYEAAEDAGSDAENQSAEATYEKEEIPATDADPEESAGTGYFPDDSVAADTVEEEKDPDRVRTESPTGDYAVWEASETDSVQPYLEASANGTVEVTTEEELIRAVNASSTEASSRTHIVLKQDISVSQKLVIPEGHYIELSGDTDGRRLGTQKKFSDSQLSPAGVILVNGDLILHTIEINGSGLTRAVAVYDGTLVLNGGTVITGGKILSHMNGGGIYIADDTRTGRQASLTINEGAKICQNTFEPATSVEASGIGLYIEQAAVVMNGGEISGNREVSTPVIRSRAASGGAVGVSGTTGSFTMNGGTIENNLVKGNGGAFRGDNASEIVINGGTIRNNTCYGTGGAIYLTSSGAGGGSLRLKGGVISGNTADATNSAPDTDRSHIGSGGAVFLESGTTMEMSAGTIEGNCAVALPIADTNGLDGGQGGAVYVNGTFTMTGGMITGNTATAAKIDGYKTGNGGGIAISGGSSPGTVTLKGGTIQGNTATMKGADIYLNGDKRAANLMSSGSTLLTTYAQGMLQIEGAPVIGNLYLPENTYFYLTGSIQQSEIGVETATKETGYLTARGGGYRVLAADARSLRNEEGRQVYNLEDGEVRLTGERTYTDLSSAVIGAIGEQVYTGQEIQPEPDVTLKGQKLTAGTDYQISYADNVNAGTAVLTVTGAGMYSGSVKAAFSILPRSLTEVKSGRQYPYLFDGKPVVPDLNLTDNGNLLEENRDYTVVLEKNDRIGTAEAILTGTGNYTGTKTLEYFIVSPADETICRDEQSLIRAVAAASGTENDPDVIYVDGEIELTATLRIGQGQFVELKGTDANACLTGCVSSKEQNEEDNILIPATDGISKTSMIRVQGQLTIGRLRLQPQAYSKARSAMERVLRVDPGGSLTLLDGCTVAGGYGYVGSGLLNLGDTTIDGAVFADNRLTSMTNGAGGAIVNDGTGVLHVLNGTFTGNLSRKGGAIYNAEGAEAYIAGGFFRDNTASADQGSSVILTGEGGAVYNDGGSLMEISGGTFTANRADDCGGGIATYGTLHMTGGVLSDNESAKNGAGLYTAGTTVIDDCLIQKNHIDNSTVVFETADGGGIFVAKGICTMNGGEICDNTVRNTYNSLTSYANAGNGGGVYVSNHEYGSSFLMHGGTIRGNQAFSYMDENVMGHGGGVYVAGGSGKADGHSCRPGTFRMDGGLITANTASGTGDGVYAASECAYSYEENRNTYIGNIKGSASVTIGKNAAVEQNTSDNLYLTEGVVVDAADSLTGRLFVTVQQGADVPVLRGNGYQLTQSDADCIVNENGKRLVQLETSENTVYFRAIHLEDAYRIKTKEKTFLYTGENICPEITVTENRDTSHVLQEGQEYTVSYTDASGSGHTADATDENGAPYVITVTGCGEYAGTLTKTYRVQPASVALVSVSIPDQYYTGKAISYLPKLGDITYGDQVLGRNQDFYIVAGSYRQNTEVGTASFQIIGNRDRSGTGTGNYTGTRTVRFRIIPDPSKVSTWQKDATGWYWLDADGKRAADTWIYSGSKWYYLKSDGYMVSAEWVRGSRGWCWLDASGACARDCWRQIGGKWYHFDPDGWMQTGWQKIGGAWYFLEASGAMASGWKKLDGKWYYLETSGAMVTGWRQIGGKWYYFAGSGAMVSDQWIGDYYLGVSGAMAVSRWIGSWYVGADGKWIPGYQS